MSPSNEAMSTLRRTIGQQEERPTNEHPAKPTNDRNRSEGHDSMYSMLPNVLQSVGLGGQSGSVAIARFASEVLRGLVN
jgi:hypothetical protein